MQQEVLAGSEAHDPIVCPNKIGPYILEDEIGQGSFSVVRSARSTSDGNIYACKVISKRLVTSDDAARLETKILMMVHHPHIVRLFDFLEDTLNCYLIMEKCSQVTLSEYVAHRKRLNERSAARIFAQVVSAVEHLHDKGIVHRDIKASNILIDGEENVKLIDFGFARVQESDNLVKTMCGTIVYTSPECLSGHKYDARTSDVWSLGVLLYSMVYGEFPWTKSNSRLIMIQIKNGEFVLFPRVSQEVRNLIAGMMVVDPEKRFTLEQVKESVWLKQSYEALGKNKMKENRDLEVLSSLPCLDSVEPKMNGRRLLEMTKRSRRSPGIRRIASGGFMTLRRSCLTFASVPLTTP